MTHCRCGLVPLRISAQSTWHGSGYRDGRWHSEAQCGERCQTVSTKGVVGWMCVLVHGHPGQHHYASGDGPDLKVCCQTVPMLGIECVLPVGHRGEHSGPPILQPRGFVGLGCLVMHTDAEGRPIACPGYPHDDPEPHNEVPPPLDPQDGDWVLIYAQVVKQERMHPDDLLVELFSHSDQYQAAVRRDRVHDTTTAPPGWPRCTRMRSGPDGTYVRCQQPERHSGDHYSTSLMGTARWTDSETAGYFEEA